jgi:multisubunit Na+/H+ antiporter MnhG subunit
MSSLLVDLGIWALLFIGVAFCGIGLIGLLIFPDTKSRMFTAFRATAIGLGAVVLAVVIYGSYALMTTGGNQYLTLTIHAVILALVLAAGTWGLYRIIQDRKPHESTCLSSDGSEAAKKDRE